MKMPQGKKSPSKPVYINELAGTFKKGGKVKNFASGGGVFGEMPSSVSAPMGMPKQGSPGAYSSNDVGGTGGGTPYVGDPTQVGQTTPTGTGTIPYGSPDFNYMSNPLQDFGATGTTDTTKPQMVVPQFFQDYLANLNSSSGNSGQFDYNTPAQTFTPPTAPDYSQYNLSPDVTNMLNQSWQHYANNGYGALDGGYEGYDPVTGTIKPMGGMMGPDYASQPGMSPEDYMKKMSSVPEFYPSMVQRNVLPSNGISPAATRPGMPQPSMPGGNMMGHGRHQMARQHMGRQPAPRPMGRQPAPRPMGKPPVTNSGLIVDPKPVFTTNPTTPKAMMKKGGNVKKFNGGGSDSAYDDAMTKANTRGYNQTFADETAENEALHAAMISPFVKLGNFIDTLYGKSKGVAKGPSVTNSKTTVSRTVTPPAKKRGGRC
jgi:hypothetical protein